MDTQVQYQELDEAGFNLAVYGDQGLGAKPWLEHPKLKYYHPWPCSLMATKVERRVFIASIKAGTSRQAVGMLEIQSSPYSKGEYWLMYVTVDPLFKRRGIAKHLVQDMAQYLKGKSQLLVRSTASAEGKGAFQYFVDQALDAAQLAWRQNYREAI